jgi:hypothetical protein
MTGMNINGGTFASSGVNIWQGWNATFAVTGCTTNASAWNGWNQTYQLQGVGFQGQCQVTGLPANSLQPGQLVTAEQLNALWAGWNASYTFTVQSGSVTPVWNGWNTGYAQVPKAQREAREAQMTEANRRYAEEQKVAAGKAKAVKERAEKLLREALSKEQHKHLKEKGFFELVVHDSKKKATRTYRIHQGTHGNVRLVEGGREVTRYCGQPVGVPVEDAMLAQKLMLETDEEGFLRVANATRLTA